MQNMEDLFVFGSGGAFQEIAIFINNNNLYRIIIVNENGMSAPDASQVYETMSEDDFFHHHADKAVNVGVFVGDIALRKKIVELIRSEIVAVRFPSFNFSESFEGVDLNEGNIIMPGCIFTENIYNIGSFNYFNFNCFIAHGVTINSFNTFSPFTKISGDCRIQSNNFFGTGSILFPNITVNNSVIGAGAVVKKSILVNKIVDIPKCIIYDKRE